MIDILEKDGATIITIQNPTPSEIAVIDKAKKVQQFAASGVWSKFKCNASSNTGATTPISSSTSKPVPSPAVQNNVKMVNISDVTDDDLKGFIEVGNLDDFEEIISDCDIDLEDLPF